MRNIIIDCDPGHDDAMAILCALAHPKELHILGITTVCGNNLVEVVTKNTLDLLSYVGAKIPVAKGFDAPLLYPPIPQQAHGVTGIDGFTFPKHKNSIVSKNAVEFLKEKILSSKKKVIIVALAPLTNIAMLLKCYPECKKKIEQIVCMGGGIHHGNINRDGEFNIYEDPTAAQMVVNAMVPMVFCPLEVCQYVSMNEKELQSLNQPGRIHKMTYGLLDFFFRYARRHHQSQAPLFDLSTILYLLHPKSFKGINCSCEVVQSGKDTRGKTIFKSCKKSHIKVLTKAKRAPLIQSFLEDIDRLEKMRK